ncbi:ABC transporter substrate-binding protein [Roseomonas sp. 18066]|uniref:ABC transporter substrate-binding protein n=1 Tax=Roseomonas sp. 18066 TaxID=2681412 RepID=UPI00135A0A76|nr:ABC transporter substrate-binding protein [Roseomonas sp. 18066]
MQRRQFLGAAAAGVFAPRLAAPALAQGHARILRFVPQTDLATPDPVWTSGTVVGTHALLIYDTLYGIDAAGQPRPQAVEGHQVSDDGLRWTFTLREGLFFHDGEPVRAQDAVPSLTRWARRNTFGQLLSKAVEEVRALDDRRFEIRLSRPFPLLTYALGSSNVFIMPERVACTSAFEKITEYTGSGPYRFVQDEWVSGARVTYARFDRYHPRQEAPDRTAGGKVAHFDRVEWIIMPDPATGLAALQTGEVDWVERGVLDLLGPIRRDRRLQVADVNPTGRIGILALNHLHPPFDNPAIRRAVLAALSQADYVAAVVGEETEFGQAGVGYFTPGSPYASEAGLSALTGPRDLAAARAAVKAAGYRGEKALIIAPSDVEYIKAMSNVTNSLLQSIGIETDYRSMDWASVLARRANKGRPDQGGWNVHCTGWVGYAYSDPAVNAPLRSDGPNATLGWPDIPEIERLRSAWLDAPGLAAQQVITRQIQEVALREVPFIPTGLWREPTVLRRELTGLLPAGAPVFWNIRRA